jgi:hypothetical protein
MKHVSSKDLTTIGSLDFPRHHRDIRLLFFPTVEDDAAGLLKSKTLKLDDIYRLRVKQLPSLDPARTYTHMREEHLFKTRRPDFLVCLDNNEYFEAFEGLLDFASKPLATWMSWTNKLNKEVIPGINVLKNILYWYDPKWTYPEVASSSLQSFQWASEVREVVIGRYVI